MQPAPNTTIKKSNEVNPLIKWGLISLVVGFLVLFLIVPMVFVFYNALLQGWSAYSKSITNPETISAIQVTFLVIFTSVPLNTFFGIVSAWLIARHEFKGKNLLITLIDLPFSISPVISGMIFVLLLGSYGLLGNIISALDVKIIFAIPGIVLATSFVTFPFVTRELIPILETTGREEEEAAISLGARGWQVFWYIVLPNIKWGLFYGVILCTARTIGEFGAVSVVSGHIRGYTNTIPLHIEILYNEYDYTGAFAVSSILTIIAFITLILKTIVEHKK